MTWLLDHGKVVAGFAAILVYGVVRVAVEAFYRRFKVSPDAVGLTETRILGRAGLFLVLFLSVVAAVVATVAVVGLATRGFGHTSESLHDHSPGNDATAAVLWSFVLVVAALPVILTVLAPELTAYLIGYRSEMDVQPAFLRMSAAAWSASLSAGTFLALRTSCPWWGRLAAPQRSRLAWPMSVAPLVLTVVFALGTKPQLRTGWQATGQNAIVAVLIIAPLIAIAWMGWSWHRTEGSSHSKRLGISVVASALVFYVANLPVVLAILDDDLIRRRFADASALFAASEESFSERLGLAGEPLATVLLWGVAFCFPVIAVRRLGGCKPHSERQPGSPVGTAAVVGCLAVVACSLLLLADGRGTTMAERVQRGDRLQPWAGLVLATSEPTCVLGADLPHPGPWMYIGEGDNTLLLHDPMDGDSKSNASVLENRTIRVPAADVKMVFLENDVFPGPRRSAATTSCIAAEESFRKHAEGDEDVPGR
ncbi:MAG TPA: hypothetical protein VGR26_08000 [Acidimicrobiales bacterium]|nr:hypothetical protein [Acidimicrobiales bacterium]